MTTILNEVTQAAAVCATKGISHTLARYDVVPRRLPGGGQYWRAYHRRPDLAGISAMLYGVRGFSRRTVYDFVVQTVALILTS